MSITALTSFTCSEQTLNWFPEITSILSAQWDSVWRYSVSTLELIIIRWLFFQSAQTTGEVWGGPDSRHEQRPLVVAKKKLTGNSISDGFQSSWQAACQIAACDSTIQSSIEIGGFDWKINPEWMKMWRESLLYDEPAVSKEEVRTPPPSAVRTVGQ